MPLPEGGCVLRPANQVLASKTLTPQQSKVLGVLKETFTSSGATKSEWQRTCSDVPERTFHRAAKVLEERGFVRSVGAHFRPTEKAL